MRRVVVTVLVVLMAPPAAAADQDAVGLTLVITGSIAALAAFNYGESCPLGYTKHSHHNLPTQCVWIGGSGSDVREATVSVDYRRPPLLWSGLVAVGAGTVLLLLPESARRIVDVNVTSTGWRASKTFGW